MAQHALPIELQIDDHQLVLMFNKYENSKTEYFRLAMLDSLRQVAITAVSRYMVSAKLIDYETGKTERQSLDKLNIRTGRLSRSIIGGFAPSKGGAVEGNREQIREIIVTPNEISGRLGSRVPYAAIHEFGGQINRGRGVRINMPARPYLRPSLEYNKTFINNMFKRAMNQIVERMTTVGR